MKATLKLNDGREIADTPTGKPDTPTILDSGSRRKFVTGAERDIQEGKGRCDLLPLDVVSICMNDDILMFIDRFQETGDHMFLISALKEFNKFNSEAEMFIELSKHFEAGAKKYTENNWKKGINAKSYIDSGVRHYLKVLRGDTDEPHERAFVWNLICCIWTCIHKPELNDYGRYENEKVFTACT